MMRIGTEVKAQAADGPSTPAKTGRTLPRPWRTLPSDTIDLSAAIGADHVRQTAHGLTFARRARHP
jgi:hypothetical protein